MCGESKQIVNENIFMFCDYPFFQSILNCLIISSLKTSLLKWVPDYDSAADEFSKAGTLLSFNIYMCTILHLKIIYIKNIHIKGSRFSNSRHSYSFLIYIQFSMIDLCPLAYKLKISLKYLACTNSFYLAFH